MQNNFIVTIVLVVILNILLALVYCHLGISAAFGCILGTFITIPCQFLVIRLCDLTNLTNLALNHNKVANNFRNLTFNIGNFGKCCKFNVRRDI